MTLPGKKPCIYYVISSDVDSSKDFLVSLFFIFLFIKLVKYADAREYGECENDVFFFLDEFANIGEIPDFNKKISTVRSRKIALIPIVQNIGQIKNRYPMDTWQEIIGNCDLRLCLGAADTLTAQYFSDLLRCINCRKPKHKERCRDRRRFGIWAKEHIYIKEKFT